METGNPKQVVILSVLAVGALGFLFTRMGGKSLPLVAKAATEAGANQKSAGALSSLPMVIDPFSHPKLVPIKTAEPSVTEAPGRLGGSTFEGGPLPFVGEFRGAGAVGPLHPEETVPVSKEAGQKASEKPAPDKPVVPEGTLVSLEATAGASDNVAFLAIDGNDSRPYRPHDLIKGRVRLLRVEDGAAIFSGPKGELTINVGERKRI